MMTGAIGRRLLRFAAVVALAGLAMGCASSQGPGSMTSPPGFGKDPASRVARLLQYCDRLTDQGELVTALGLCARASEIEPENPEPLLKVAAILQTMNRKDAAAQTYDLLLQRHPTHHEAQYLLGKLYMETGKSDLASITFNHALRSDPADPRPYNALGILRDQAGEHEAAQGLYRLALERDPANLSVRNNLGLSLALDGKRDEAIELLAELAVEPEAGQTVMRNLEAAYASRAMPPAGSKPAALPPLPLAPTADPVAPVSSTPLASEPVTEPAPEEVPMKAQTDMPKGHEPGAPEAGAPTPLFFPPSAKSGKRPEQSGARQLPIPDPAAEAAGSAILQAAERLMQPPEWADFEPGELLSQQPPPVSAPAALSQSGAAEVGRVDTIGLVGDFQLGTYSLSLLFVSHDTACA